MRPRSVAETPKVDPAAKRQPVDILALMDKPSLFGDWFYPSSDWFNWRVALAAAFGLPIERTLDPDAALKLFTECTGRTKWPTQQSETVAFIVGARGGKSRIAALTAVYLACLRNYSDYLAPGERGVLPVVAADKKQARVVFNYAAAYVTRSDVFNGLLEEEPLKERLSFNNNIDLEIMTGAFRTLRGYTTIGAVLDEIAIYRSEDSANPDVELIQSVRRGTITIPGSMIIMISSPYAKRGVLYETYKSHWAVNDSPTFVWNAPTWVMHPSVTRESLQDEFDRDPEKATADYGANFRKDVERFVQLEVIEACVDVGRIESIPSAENAYFAFVDPSGGSGDSFTAAVGHRQDEEVIIDAIREWQPPFSPDSVVGEIAEFLKPFDIREVVGDRYAGLWPSERFTAHGLVYTPSASPKSDLYRDMLPLLNSRRAHLPDIPRLRKQLWELERRSSRAGKDIIDHQIGARDDVANAVAGVCSLLSSMGNLSLTW